MREIKKIALLGEGAVGKTALIQRFVYNTFNETYIQTIGARISKKSVMFGEDEVILIIWDILGQRYHDDLHKGHYSGTEGALFVFDLTRRDTFEKLEPWMTSLQNTVGKVPSILLANKSDLPDWQVSLEEIESFATARGMPYFITSAKTGANVNEAFTQIGSMLLRR
ncbi:MAG: GTP-binding protein [Thermoplasmata archaeon]|nr:GTP-binding protein [Thermoplasmata archaeon]